MPAFWTNRCCECNSEFDLFAIASCELVLVIGCPIGVGQEPCVFGSGCREVIPRNRLNNKIADLDKKVSTLEGKPRFSGVIRLDLFCMIKLYVLE